ncbi:hypothetical protein AX16_004793 [Volvariella volvacea WC 439]|nr:hypothetical protein AX16_004793 [Volvariella volvacea WC 439]
MDTAPEGERDITPTQHHASKAGDMKAAILAQEEAIFERVANWTPSNNNHLVQWDPLSGTRGDIDIDTFLGCEFKAAAYTRRYDIRGWLLYRHLSYPNTEVYIYLPMDIPLEEMQVSYFLACCGLQIFPEEMRDYQVPTCIIKHLTNAGSNSNPHWILAGDANPFIPVHRVGATDDDATGDPYSSPQLMQGPTRQIKQEEAEGPLDPTSREAIAPTGISNNPESWGESPAITYRTPSLELPTGMDKGKERERSMSPHRYLSPTPLPTGLTPPGNQLAVFPQVDVPFSNPIVPQGAPMGGSVRGHPDQVDSAGNRFSFGVSQSPIVPDHNWHVFSRSEDRNAAVKGINITETLRKGTNGKKHVPTPFPRNENVYIRNWDEVLVIPKGEYIAARGRNGKFKSKTYGSNTIPDVPQAAFVDEGDSDAWAEWSVEAMRNIAFITDFGRYDMIARGLTDPTQFDKISVFSTEQKRDLIALMIQLITSLPTEATTEADWLRSINRTMPWMYGEEAEDLATRIVQIEASIRSTDRACDYIHRDYMSFAGAQDGKTLMREWKKWSRQFYAKYGYANTWRKDPLQPSIPQVWAAMIKGDKIKNIDVSGRPEPHQVVQRMVAQWLPDQKATKSNAPAKPSYSIRETSVVMDSYDKVMHATSHLPRKLQVQIVNTMAMGTAQNPINIDDASPSQDRQPTPPPPVPPQNTRPQRKNPPSSIVVPTPPLPDPPRRPIDKPSTSTTTTNILKTEGLAPPKPSFAQAAARGSTAPPPFRPKTWIPMPQRSEKTPKKDERTVFHEKNVTNTLSPNTIVTRIVTNEPTHVKAIATLLATKKEAIFGLDPELVVIDEGPKHVVLKASNQDAANKILEAYNNMAAEYSRKFDKDPKYSNFFAATTKVQNTAQYTPSQLLEALKLNKGLSDKIFVSQPTFIGKGEYTSMLAFNIIEFGGDQNKLDGARVLIHDEMSTILRRRFKARALFCSKCSRWGHAAWSPCRATVISCGICAGLHPANRHSPAYDKQPHKCINCNGAHTADSPECPCFVNRHDVWELRSILEKVAAERKAGAKASKADKGKEKAKDDMEVDGGRDGFDIAPAEEVDGWSKVGPAVVSLNCQKSSRTIRQFLERTCDTDIDLIFIQEAPYGFLKTVTSSTNKHGDDYHGLPIHPAYKLIETLDPSSRVAAYASKRLVQAKIMHHQKAVSHPDLMLISFKSDGERLYLLNIYNDEEDHALSYLSSHPNLPPITAIVGDFNISDERWDKFCPTSNRRTRKINDIATLTYTDVITPEEPTHPARHVNERPSTIDFALISIDRLEDANIEVAHDLQTDSDHRTLVLSLQRITTERTTRRVLSRIKPNEDTPSPRDQFISRMLAALSDYHPDPSIYLEKAQTTIKAAFLELSHVPSIGPHSKRWWDGECTRLQREVETAQDPATKRLKRKERNTYEAKVRREYFDNLLKERVGNVRPWDVLSWTCPRPPPDYKEIVVPTGEKLTVDRAWPHLNAKFQAAASRPIDQEYIDSLPQQEERDCPPISTLEIREALADTSNTSAPGEDHITWEVLKIFARSAGVEHLRNTFNKILDTGIWPECLKSADTVIIPKPGKDLSSVSGYRPIALFSTVAKLMEKILSNRLQWEAAKFSILHPNQHGGTKKHSTDDAGMLLVHQIKRGWEWKKVTSCLAFDIASFFPSVQPDALNRVLLKQGFNRKYTSLFRSYFQGRSTTYRLGEYKSESFPVEVGLGQGSAIFPTLSALYIAPGLKTLTDEVGDEEDALQIYVDDGVWASTGDTLSDNCARLKHRYIRTRDVLGKLGLIVEHTKTELKHFYTAKVKGAPSLLTSDTTPTIDLEEAPYTGDTPLKEKQIWRYLGFFLDSSLSFKFHISFYANKAFSTSILYSLLGNSVRGLTPKHKRMLYRGCIMPLMTYGFQLWYRLHGKRVKHKIEVLKVAQNRALRWITGAFRTTPIGSLESAAGCLPFHIHLERFYRRYTTRWQTTYPSHPLSVILHDPNATSPTHTSTTRLRSSDSPIEHVRRHNEKHPIQERRNLLIPENAPGKRLLETHRGRIHFDLTHPPKSSSNAYHAYSMARKQLFQYLVAGRIDKVQSPSLEHINTTPFIIFSDGSERSDHQYASGSAYTAYTQNTRIVSGKKFAGRCTNYEAEVFGMGLGVLHALANLPLVRIWGEDPIFAEIRHPDHLIIAADNEAAMKCLLSPDTHAAQSLSIPVIRAVKTWMDADDRRTITFIHCPAHKGIELNELVDKDAKAAALIQPNMDFVPRSIAWERAEIDRTVLQIWKGLPAERWGKSSHFLREHSNWKNQGGIHMKRFGGDTKRYAQFIRSSLPMPPSGNSAPSFSLRSRHTVRRAMSIKTVTTSYATHQAYPGSEPQVPPTYRAEPPQGRQQQDPFYHGRLL